MKRITQLCFLLSSVLAVSSAIAQAGAAPAGSTGVCKDGSYSTAATKKGACRGHQGVKEWFSAADTGAATSAPAAKAPPMAKAAPTPAVPAAAAAPVAAPAPAPASAPAAAKATTTRPAGFTPPAVAAAGGGAGKVWVNKSSKVYHCADDKWYGKTKDGAYMTESEATSAGYHADHGKACKS